MYNVNGYRTNMGKRTPYKHISVFYCKKTGVAQTQ